MTASTSTLTLKTAIGSYGHVQALKDGSLAPNGVVFDHVEVSPIIAVFRRMCRALEFDVSEMAMTTYLTARAYGLPFTALPVFPVRAFHHGATAYNVNAGVQAPKDLEGKQVGVRAYTVTTGVWARGILRAEHGVDHAKVTWVLGDEEHVEAYHADAPPNAEYRVGADLAQMLAAGELAGGIGLGRIESADVRPLIADAQAAAAESYRRTGVYPINHTIVVKDELLASNPNLAPALFEAFKAAKERWLSTASEADRAKAGHGIVEGDPYPYGVEANRKTLETLVQYAIEQRILKRPIAVEEMFAKGTLLT